MTCIVGLEDPKRNRIIIGGDAAAFSVDAVDVFDKSKVFKIQKKLILGYCGSFRMGQVLEHHLKFKAIPNDEKWLYTKFVKALKDTFVENEIFFSPLEDGVYSAGEIMVGFQKKIYVVQSDFSLLRSTRGYAALGAGEHAAKGSLFSTDGLIEDPVERVDIALKAAQTFCPSVKEPFTILEG